MIKTKYKNCEITINKTSDIKCVPVFLPYIMGSHTEESLKEYNDFMEEYENKHQYCPKCGSDDCITTLVGYILNRDKKEEYKDLNICTCMKCGDKHTFHDRVEIFE
jgi:DNA-directed RNA polymerase subunit M/transcription elongation factor TFIIS